MFYYIWISTSDEIYLSMVYQISNNSNSKNSKEKWCFQSNVLQEKEVNLGGKNT